MRRHPVARLLDRFERAIAGHMRRVCPICGLATESRELCVECRAASALGRVWRLRWVGAPGARLAVFALGLYRGPDGSSPSPAAVALMRFKYGRDRAFGRALLRSVTAAQALEVARDAAIVPIPLHTRRLRERGFNQAAWLAREFARRNGASLAVDALSCVAPSPRRPGLSRAGRSSTSLERFSADHRLSPHARVVLFDDVCTTGLTLCAARAALEDVGVTVRAAAVLLSTERVEDSTIDGDDEAML